MATCPTGHESEATDYCDICGTVMGGPPVAAPSGVPSGMPASSATPVPAAPAANAEGGRSTCPDCDAPRTGRFCEECGFDYAVEVSGAIRMAEQAQSVQAMLQGRTAAQSAQSGRSSRPQQTAAFQAAGPPPTAPPVGPPVMPAPVTTPQGVAPDPQPQAAEATYGGAWEAVVTADRDYYNTIIGMGGPDASSVPFPPYCPERRFPLTGQQVRIGRRSRSRNLSPEIDLTGPPEDPGVSHLHAVLLAQPDGTWMLVDPGSANGTAVNGSRESLPQNVPVPVGDGDRIQLGAWTVITLRKG
ncbi:FHA domain-containing protein [Spongiactinospora sp. TRM90649]|uniref:FHA domain-containing protein n=1 Tax=Spongiactinospora sp. TRM90649 TaxID=3031114 RepID=UPI0023F7FA68|nr:FHA domain-containing protein [Spongiactinospora sp. TRM90649]MDF5751884.1 FHA domain-containing protein [Spongiactinospora sp. TRM90649]